MEIDEVLVKENPGVCRCCLSEGCYKDLASEYAWMGDTEVYADMLLDCFDISISQHSDGPNGPNRLICEVCITRLRDACNFKKQVVESEKKFVDMLGRGEFKSSDMVTTLKIEPANDDGPDADVEYLDDMDFDDDSEEEDVPLKHLASTSHAEDVKPKKPRKKAAVVKTEKTIKKEKKKTATKPKNYPNDASDKATSIRQSNLETLFRYTTITPFRSVGKLTCFYCSHGDDNYKQLKEHILAHDKCDINTSEDVLKSVKKNICEINVDVSDIRCELCDLWFSNLEEIVNHLVDVHDLDYDRDADLLLVPYRLSDMSCHKCGDKFETFIQLSQHYSIDHPFVCNICGKTFSKMSYLKIHSRIFHKDTEHKCVDCGVTFSNDQKLKSHIDAEHNTKSDSNDKTLKCEFCLTICENFQDLNSHSRKCMDLYNKSLDQTQPFSSNSSRSCSDPFRRNVACIINMSTAIPFKHFRSEFLCFFCPEYFKEPDSLKEHTILAHSVCDSNKLDCHSQTAIKFDILNLTCKICNKLIDDLDSLIDHLIADHEAAYDKAVSMDLQAFKLIKDNYQCLYCPNVSFTYMGSLLKHLNFAHSGDTIICETCGLKLRSLSKLRGHILCHHAPKQFKCNKCNQAFRMKAYLKYHQAKVHSEKNVLCPHCPKKFSNDYFKKKHMISAHNFGYKCQHCDRVFTRDSFLRDHIRRTHLREKNVECTVCHVKFFDHYMLKAHMVKHTGDRNFQCDKCDATFLRSKNLARHMDTHQKSND